MYENDYLARNYTDTEMHALLLDVFSNVSESHTPFFVRLIQRFSKNKPLNTINNKE